MLHWIVWELKKIIELSFADKLIVVFPQDKTLREKGNTGGDHRLAVLVEVFSGTPWEADLARIVGCVQPEQIRSVIFRANGKVFCVTSRFRNRESYHLAAIIAQYVQMQDRGEISAATMAVKSRRWLRRAAWATASVGALFVLFVALGLYELGQEAAFEPLPVSIPVTTTGALKVGNFQFVEQRGGPARASTFKPGDEMQISYDVQGFAIGDDGYPYVEAEATLLDATGAQVSDPVVSRFHQSIKTNEGINFWIAWDMASSASSGDYRIDIRLRDVVANTSLAFQPQFHMEEKSSE